MTHAFENGSKAPKSRAGRPMLTRVLVGGSLSILLAGLIVKLAFSGTLVVRVNEPGSVVQVQNREGTIKVNRRVGKEPITISVVPGRYQLKVARSGFESFSEDVEIRTGERKTIEATLVPTKVPVTQPIKPWSRPAFQHWMDEVAALPADKQVQAVARKLRELNPQFDGKVSSHIKDGVVRRVFFEADNITDISPVRALPGLKELYCSSDGRGKSKFSDLSPLKGLALTTLDCGWSQVADLSPLKDMPLTRLFCPETQISDLSPLQGMQLATLFLHLTKVSDLSPLRMMPLTDLRMTHTSISDLTPLTECKSLQYLNIKGTHVTAADVAALQEALPKCRIYWDGAPKEVPRRIF